MEHWGNMAKFGRLKSGKTKFHFVKYTKNKYYHSGNQDLIDSQTSQTTLTKKRAKFHAVLFT